MKRICLSFAVLVAITGCESGPSETNSTVLPAAQGQRGESCRARNDCEAGLACIGGVCTRNDFEIADSARSCSYVQCREAADCTNYVDECVTLQAACDGGDNAACTEVDTTCVFDCADNRCQTVCADDVDCFGFVCEGGACVQCRADDQCFGDQECVGNVCIDTCDSDLDCPLFWECAADGGCVEGGCNADRECIALTNNPESICTADGCATPCVNDAECQFGFGFDFWGCVEGACKFLGCESDDECRAAAYGNGAVFGEVLAIECVEDPASTAPPPNFDPPGFCLATERRCDDAGGFCIPGFQICDGVSNCADGSDEIDCPPCPPGNYTCAISGACIPDFWLCDGFVDCPDGEDEAACP